ncbi:hypothetical protein [Fulvivirga sedimenti]|uniref:Uncharacterized protein n=1 Tax=Fulvivirga sedimenti TaxID=2879465 RepID=A0A9X1HXF8_9BACT|nr:hypothetical protein [Fulvivirga sedimenti]MCA6078232.1 hypothetical protein [Fulvivirga sedimenti]
MGTIGWYSRIFKSIILIGCFLGITMACATKPPSQPAAGVSSYTVYESPITSQSILLLGFTLIERSNGDSVFIIMKEFSSGRIVERNEIQDLEKGDIRIQFLNYSGSVVKSLLVRDPTRQEIETFTQSGEVEGVIIEEKRVDFYVRINFDPEIQLIKLYRQGSAGEQALIFATQITRS